MNQFITIDPYRFFTELWFELIGSHSDRQNTEFNLLFNAFTWWKPLVIQQQRDNRVHFLCFQIKYGAAAVAHFVAWRGTFTFSFFFFCHENEEKRRRNDILIKHTTHSPCLSGFFFFANYHFWQNVYESKSTHVVTNTFFDLLSLLFNGKMPDRTQFSRMFFNIQNSFEDIFVCLDLFSFCNDKIIPFVMTTNHSNGSFQIERFSQIQYVSIKEITMFHNKQNKSFGSAMIPKARPFDEFFINSPAMISSNNSFDGENNDMLIKLNKDWNKFKLIFSFLLSFHRLSRFFWLRIKNKKKWTFHHSITRRTTTDKTETFITLRFVETYLISNEKTADAHSVCLKKEKKSECPR